MVRTSSSSFSLWQLLSFSLFYVCVSDQRVDAATVNVMEAEIKEELKSGFVAVFMTLIRYTKKKL